jgi:hypothetical protein
LPRSSKQVDLFKKWRKFVPTRFQDAICPRPPDEMLEEIAEQRVESDVKTKQVEFECQLDFFIFN